MMRAVTERVREASVLVDQAVVARISKGLLIYLGVERDDSQEDARYIAEKIRYLRIFPDRDKPMNRDVAAAGGEVLVVSAFTTVGDARRGRRPSFEKASRRQEAEPLYEHVCDCLTGYGLVVRRRVFGAMMQVRSHNDGPVCVLLDSKRVF